jgi:hypothetical protein
MARSVGGLLLHLGAMAVVSPASMLANSEYPLPGTEGSYERRLCYTMVRIYGVRNVTLATICGLLWLNGDPVLMGRALLLGTAMPVADGIFSLNLIGGEPWKHWIFVPIALGVVDGLLW